MNAGHARAVRIRDGFSRRALFSLSAFTEHRPSVIDQVEPRLRELLSGVDGITFRCESAPAAAPLEGWVVVELPTLALLTPGWLLQMLARGVEVRLAPCGNECCAPVAGVEALAAGIAAEPQRVLDDTDVSLSEPRATVEAVLALSRSQPTLRLEDDAAPLGLLEVSDQLCTLCGACVTRCPEDALSLDETEEGSALGHDPAACTGCSLCVSVCPESAIDVRRGIDLERLQAGSLELVRSARERCTVCGSELPPLPLRRRVNELLGDSDAPLELCRSCAMRSRPA